MAAVGLAVLVAALLVPTLGDDDGSPTGAEPPRSSTTTEPPPATTADAGGTTEPPTTTTTTTSTTTTTTTTTVPPAPQPTGTFTYASTADVTYGAPPYFEFSVAAEDGTGISPDELAAFVDETLSDPRSWIGDGRTGFRRVAEGGRFTLVVATGPTVDRLCEPLQTVSTYSCARNGWVAINYDRWTGATDSWTAPLELYRRYVVNHEVGHYLGQQHTGCPGPGQPAPVMMQQTKGLDGCLPNGWPHPGGN